MNRPTSLLKDATLYWVMRLYNSSGALVDADSTPTVAVRKNGAAVLDSVTVTKRSATTGIYDCSYNPSGEVEGDQFTIEETAVISATTYVQSWEFRVFAAERGTDSAYTGTPPTAGAIADAVWDEATSGHQTAGTTGKALTDAATVTVTPLSSGDIQRVVGTKIQLYRGEAITHTISSITDANGDEVNLIGKTLTVVIDRIKGSSHPDFETVSATVLSAASVSFTNTILSSNIAGSFRWSLREPSNGDYVWARGTWEVLDTATED